MARRQGRGRSQSFRFPVARVRAYMSGNYRFTQNLPDWKLFREPRTRRRLGEQNDPVVQKRLLDTGVIGCAGGPPVMFALPETHCALIYTQRGAKGALGQPSQNPGGAELATCDKVLAVSPHGILR